MSTLLWVALAVAAVWALAYFRTNRIGWLAGVGVFLLAVDWWSGIGGAASTVLWLAFLAAGVLILIPGLRRSLVSDRLLTWFRGVMP